MYVQAWDTLLCRDQGARKKVFEVHPEVSFFALNRNKPLRHGKKSPEGKKQRRQLLDKSFDKKRVASALADLAVERFGMDDFHDAFAALWSACRITRKEACCLPEQPPTDTCGLKMGIWY
jgi:predicted RNase H-like nuclease